MFFTDISWKASYRFSSPLHAPFERWNVIGVTNAAPKYLVVANDVLCEDPSDSCSWLIATPEYLIGILQGFGPHQAKVFALTREQLINVNELWLYRLGSDAAHTYYAYCDQQGILHKCQDDQPDVPPAAGRLLVWTPEMESMPNAALDSLNRYFRVD